jgi:hypothetical protein
MLMYDDQVYVDKLLYFHVKDQEPKYNYNILKKKKVKTVSLQQHIFSMNQIIYFDEVFLRFSPSCISKSNLLYFHHYLYIHWLFHMLLYIYLIKMIDQEHNQLLFLSKSKNKRILKKSKYLKNQSFYIFWTIGLENISNFSIFHPKCMIISINWNSLPKKTWSRHMYIEYTWIEIIRLKRKSMP